MTGTIAHVTCPTHGELVTYPTALAVFRFPSHAVYRFECAGGGQYGAAHDVFKPADDVVCAVLAAADVVVFDVDPECGDGPPINSDDLARFHAEMQSA